MSSVNGSRVIDVRTLKEKMAQNQGNASMNGTANGTANGTSNGVREEPRGDEFLRKVVSLILDEAKIVGSGHFVKKHNEKLVDFKQPKDLEDELDLVITKGKPDDGYLLELCRKVVKYSIKTTHPHFYNQLYAGIDEYSLAGAWLTDALNTSQATYEISPVFTLMERSIMKYLGKLCGWNEGDIDGIFAPGGSMANIYGIILSRHQKFPESKKKGIQGLGQLVIFVSEGGHYSFVKGSIWLGMGSECVVKVKTDDKGKMDPNALEGCIKNALAEGKVPFFVGCTGGTTVLGAFDPLRPVSKICQKYGIWLHVDAALGGTVLFSRKHRQLLDGIEFADSMTWNLHKLGGVPLQCSAFITRHPTLLTEASSLNAEYLFQSDKYYDASYDSGDKSIQCGRKVDSLKLWLALAARGEQEMERLVDNLFDIALYVRKRLEATEGFRLVLPEYEGNNICFWYIPPMLRQTSSGVTEGAADPLPEHSLLSKVCPAIKGKMMEAGNLMVNYQPLTSKQLPNFFRLVLTCLPPSSREDMDFVVDQIRFHGDQLRF